MNSGAMVDYFDYKGRRYYRGSVFECNNFFGVRNKEFPTIKVTFWQLNRRNGICFIQNELYACQHLYDFSTFTNNIVSVVEAKTPRMTGNTEYKDNIEYYHWVEDGEDFYKKKPDNLVYGWIWYILLMAIATIFKQNIGLWILISFVFFRWRKKKILEG